MFLKLLFLKSYEMLGDLWWTLSLYQVVLWCSFLFFIINMGYMSKGFIVIGSSLGIRPGDPLGGPLFALAHYWALVETIAQTPNCVLPSLMDDTNIMGVMNEVVFTFDHLSTQLDLVRLKVKVSKCKLWNP